MSYLNLQQQSIRVQQGIADVEHTHTDTHVDLEQAIELANKYNSCEYHPDVFVVFPEHHQVCKGEEIIGFISIEEVKLL